MAKLTVEIDTEEQTATVLVDGAEVGNVGEINVANWGHDGKPQFSFSVSTYEKVGGVTKITRLMAADSTGGVEARSRGQAKASALIPGYVEVPALTRAQEGVVTYLSKCLPR